MATKTAADPNQLFIALDSHIAVVNGQDVVIKENTRLRGDHPAVRFQPELFAPDGLDDQELDGLKAARLNAAIANAVNPTPALPKSTPRF